MSLKPVASTYDDAFFAEHTRDINEYRRLADCVYTTLGPLSGLSVLDVGCGSGEALERLGELGCKILGLEGSEIALKYASPTVRPHIQIVDIREYDSANWDGSKFDLVMSTECAEHIAPEYADRFVSLLCDHAKHMIFLTAAPEGQGGTDHVNCRNPPYWIDKFNQRGWRVDGESTFKLRDELQRNGPKWQTWYAANAICFCK